MWEINFGLLRKAIDSGHCLCDLGKKCPCDAFINEQKCRCGVYKKAGFSAEQKLEPETKKIIKEELKHLGDKN